MSDIQCPNCCRNAIPFQEWEPLQCDFCAHEFVSCVECDSARRVTVDYHMDDPSMVDSMIDCPVCDGFGLVPVGE
jgi:hypothetical protein